MLAELTTLKTKHLKRFGSGEPGGFALVVTLSMLVLLMVVAIGLLSLSSVVVRSSSRGEALGEARANARLALVLAIGELQKSLGPDQRVSANGAILDDPESKRIRLHSIRDYL